MPEGRVVIVVMAYQIRGVVGNGAGDRRDGLFLSIRLLIVSLTTGDGGVAGTKFSGNVPVP